MHEKQRGKRHADAVAALHCQELLVRREGEGRPVRICAGEASEQMTGRYVPYRHSVLRSGSSRSVPRQRVAFVQAEEHTLHVFMGKTTELVEIRAAVENNALAMVSDHVSA